MSLNKLKDFFEKENNIPYISWYKHIGDFLLEKSKNDKKIIDDAKVWYTIYWINSLEELKNTSKKIIVVIPALTWTSKLFDTNDSQWDWWWNTYGKPWNILDPNTNIIIWLDYFGSAFNTHPDKHNLNFYPVPPEKQVEAWKKWLQELWVKNIDILFWWSNWWWHIHHWIIDKNKELEPEYLIPISWPISLEEEAREFFSIQLDFLKSKKDVAERLEQNIKKIKWKTILFDKLLQITKEEIIKYHNSDDIKILMKIVRQIWFLKFVWPEFYHRFKEDKYWKRIEKEEEQVKNMMNYFEKQGEKFEKRIWKSYFITLLEWLTLSSEITSEEYVENIWKKVNIILINTKDDTLFDSIEMWKYFLKVQQLREQKRHIWKTIIHTIHSNKTTKQAGHDYFLWPQWAQKINDIIMQIIGFKI
jgi:homoserine acetyltransferase